MFRHDVCECNVGCGWLGPGFSGLGWHDVEYTNAVAGLFEGSVGEKIYLVISLFDQDFRNSRITKKKGRPSAATSSPSHPLQLLRDGRA